MYTYACMHVLAQSQSLHPHTPSHTQKPKSHLNQSTNPSIQPIGQEPLAPLYTRWAAGDGRMRTVADHIPGVRVARCVGVGVMSCRVLSVLQWWLGVWGGGGSGLVCQSRWWWMRSGWVVKRALEQSLHVNSIDPTPD